MGRKLVGLRNDLSYDGTIGKPEHMSLQGLEMRCKPLAEHAKPVRFT